MKTLPISPDLYDYMCRHSSGLEDPLLNELRQVTGERFGDDAIMQISEIQGCFLTLLVSLSGVQTALEIGTFTGYSSICIARGLGPEGKLTCLDISSEWTDIARDFWERDEIVDRITLMLGPAIKTLDSLPEEPTFDFAFIDAEKTEYEQYLDRVLTRIKPGGLILFDNMLRDGRVLDQTKDPGTAVIARLNQRLTVDSRIENVLLPIADGLQVCRVI